MTDINSIAQKIFTNLDTRDGLADNKIGNNKNNNNAASIWNDFAGTAGGNKINNYINKDNAIKSIEVYLERVKNDVNKYQALLAAGGITSDNDSSSSQTETSKDLQPLSKTEISRYNTQDKSKAGQTISQNETGKDLIRTEYDNNGFIIQEYNETKGTITLIDRKDDGSIQGIMHSSTKPTDNAGKKTSTQVYYNPDGTVKEYTDEEYDANGVITKDTTRDANNKILASRDYNSKGNPTRRTFYNDDGSVKNYLGFDYDSNDNISRTTTYQANGEVSEYSDWEQDSDGNTTKQTVHNSDGSIKETSDYEYKNGKLSKETIKNSEGKITNIIEYNDNGQPKKEIVYNDDGSIKEIIDKSVDK